LKKVKKIYVSYDELYKAYLDCRKRKRNTRNEIIFEIDENVNLLKLWYEINTFTYLVGNSICFIVKKPVCREIFAADFRDRILHHLFMNRIIKYVEKEFIDDAYSCRVGKGTQYGVKRLYENVKECSDSFTKDCYILKCDLKSFFMNINKDILFDKLYKFLIENCKYSGDELIFMTFLLRSILYDEPEKKCIIKGSISDWNLLPKEKSLFYSRKNKGLPIGNLTSQIFANLYLSYFDHFIVEELGFKYYGRYVDDFYIIHENKNVLLKSIKSIREKLLESEVTLHPKKLYLQHYKHGVSFLGHVIKPNRIYIGNRTKGNFYDMTKKYYNMFENNTITRIELNNFVSSVNSYLGFMKNYNTYNIRKKMLLKNKYMWPFYEFGYTNIYFDKISIKKKKIIYNINHENYNKKCGV